MTPPRPINIIGLKVYLKFLNKKNQFIFSILLSFIYFFLNLLNNTKCCEAYNSFVFITNKIVFWVRLRVNYLRGLFSTQ